MITGKARSIIIEMDDNPLHLQGKLPPGAKKAIKIMGIDTKINARIRRIKND